MLSETMLEKLNGQIGIEFESANLYLQMSSWCAVNGLEGSADFLRAHSHEEMEHMFKLFDYVIETGSKAHIPELAEPRSEFESIREVFESTLEHERFVTGKINELVRAAYDENDYSTLNFLQWYVAEQHEEEALFSRIVEMVHMIGTSGRDLYLLDKEIGAMGAQDSPGGTGASAP